MSAFFEAIGKGDLDLIKTLAKEDSSLLQLANESGVLPISWAIYNFQRDTARWLVENGSREDLYTSCCFGDSQKVAEYAKGENIETLSQDGFTALALASAFGGPECVQVLLLKGANPNQRSTALGEVAPIHAAIFGRQFASLELLIRAGADVNAPQVGGFTPLMGAAQNGSVEFVRVLLESGADPSMKSGDGQTALDIAKAQNHTEVVSLIMKNSM